MKIIVLILTLIATTFFSVYSQNREAIEKYIIENINIKPRDIRRDSVMFALENDATIIMTLTFDRVGQIGNIDMAKSLGNELDNTFANAIYPMSKGISDAIKGSKMVIGFVLKLKLIDDKDFTYELEREYKRVKHKKIKNSDSEEFLSRYPEAEKYVSTTSVNSSLWLLRYRLYQLTVETLRLN